jgi:hypothetical protein
VRLCLRGGIFFVLRGFFYCVGLFLFGLFYLEFGLKIRGPPFGFGLRCLLRGICRRLLLVFRLLFCLALLSCNLGRGLCGGRLV